MRIENIKEEQCTGCHACFNSCLRSAIRMVENKEGFLYPLVDHVLCVECGACDRACPQITGVVNGNTDDCIKWEPKAYAAVCNSPDIRDRSSSGGIFFLIAEKIIKHGGVVYGAVFNKDWEVYHERADRLSHLEKMQGSKYVQSSIGEIYKDVKKKLIAKKKVLFSGTPCQCEGLYGYLGKQYENLYVIDLICHGVPSPLVWRKYVQYIREKKHKTIKHISFRSKNLSWERFLLEFTFTDSSKYSNDLDTDIYMRGFLRDLYLRKSCYECPSRRIHRFSDITLADFWGVKSVMPSMYNEMGTSLVVIQTKKGADLLFNINARVEEVDFYKAMNQNTAYFHSPAIHIMRDTFFKRLNGGECLISLIRGCLREPISQRISKTMKNIKCKVKSLNLLFSMHNDKHK